MLYSMKTLFRVLCVLMFTFGVLLPGVPAAQGQNLPKKVFQKVEKAAGKAQKAAQKAARAAAVRARAAFLAGAKRTALPPEPVVYNAASVKENIRSAVFFMFTPDVQASGFFMEENYMGKRLVWAVLPAHAIKDGKPFFVAEYLGVDGTIYQRVLRVVAYGSAGYQNYDFALALLPKEMEKHVFALRLAPERPKKGDEVTSFGFYEVDEDARFAGAPKENTGRVIQSIDNSRITTSYPFGNHDPNGACGGPLLNEKGEVVGIHSGSNGSCSFAVEATGPVREMLADVHGDKQILRPVLWKGKEITLLFSAQRISRITVKRDGQEIGSILLTRRAEPFDYRELHKLFPQAQSGDEVYLELKDQRLTEPEIIKFEVD